MKLIDRWEVESEQIKVYKSDEEVKKDYEKWLKDKDHSD